MRELETHKMNVVKGIVIMLLRILAVNTSDVVSEEKDLVSQRSNDHIQHHPEGTERRFIEDLDDKDWHVMHLKDIDFDFKNDCKEETFINKVNRYRKTLKEDGSLVEYVSADALPVSEADLNVKKCVAGNITQINKKPKNVRFANLTDSVYVADPTANGTVITKQVDTATTVDMKPTLKQAKNATGKNSRRASEYQFSSDEYYEEIDEFDDNLCPDFVEVIHLEIDTLRSYDVECERIVEWRSLE